MNLSPPLQITKQFTEADDAYEWIEEMEKSPDFNPDLDEVSVYYGDNIIIATVTLGGYDITLGGYNG